MARVAALTYAKSLTALFALLLVAPSNALAWGYEGHQIIAEIAEQFLEPQTTKQVRDLLAIENVTTLAEVSTWADEIRPQHPETRPWHYVNIPIYPASHEPKGYDAGRDCPHDDCVVAKIKQFERVLADRQAPERQRLEALKYLVHYIGDIHQPLHASDNHDRGGNDVTVTFMGRGTNLHAVWDSGILAPVVRGDERSYALRLMADITPAVRMQWSQSDPISWANESHEIAAQVIYEKLPHSGVLPDSYKADALPIVNEQLERAGVRLAMVLNESLR
jgi:S1/P1 Nuclease